MKPELTQERLKEVLNYDPETGVFTRKISTAPKARAGMIAGSKNDCGYLLIVINRKSYSAHRLAYFYVNGFFPTGDVDHINGIRDDNSIKNLRVGTRSQNLQNSKKARSHNKSSGFLGVNFHATAKKYQARIKANGRSKSLGLYDTPEEAHAAYIAAKRELHEFNTL
jgi:hypothetical protein